LHLPLQSRRRLAATAGRLGGRFAGLIPAIAENFDDDDGGMLILATRIIRRRRALDGGRSVARGGGQTPILGASTTGIPVALPST
jgi:hypothetical protein